MPSNVDHIYFEIQLCWISHRRRCHCLIGKCRGEELREVINYNSIRDIKKKRKKLIKKFKLTEPKGLI